MKREEMIAMAEDAGIKVDSRWSDETLAKKLADPTEPVESDDEIKVENILNSMGNSHVKVICTCDNVYLGDLRLTVKRKGAMVENVEFLINRDTCDMPETLANFLEAREQVAII